MLQPEYRQTAVVRFRCYVTKGTQAGVGMSRYGPLLSCQQLSMTGIALLTVGVLYRGRAACIAGLSMH